MNYKKLKTITFFSQRFDNFLRQIFVNIDTGSQDGTQWTCFHIKGDKSFYFDGFGGAPVKILFNHILKPINYQYNKIQYINSRLYETNCLNVFYLIETMC